MCTANQASQSGKLPQIYNQLYNNPSLGQTQMTQSTAFTNKGFMDGFAYPIRNSQGYKDWLAINHPPNAPVATAATPTAPAPVVDPTVPAQTTQPVAAPQEGNGRFSFRVPLKINSGLTSIGTSSLGVNIAN